LVVTFDGVPGGGSGGFTYRWNFGDNTTSTDADPAHTYAAPGIYTVVFTVIDAATGCQASQTQTITL
jgi:PKD repeat protein